MEQLQTPYSKYLFIRWLAEAVSDKEKKNHAMSVISYYVYEKNRVLPFTDVFVVGDTVYVFTERPGLWIGKSGRTYDEILERLNSNAKGEKTVDYKLKLKEDMKSPKYDFDMEMRMCSYIYSNNEYNI
jgi:predicted metal-dependent RNase